jgi:hypothetical protein
MKDVFVLATGPSIRDLTDEERDYINSCNTYAVNDFLIHHKKANLYPKNWVYIDLNEKTKKYLQETHSTADYLNCNWFISKEHVDVLTSLDIYPQSPITQILSKYSYTEWGEDITKTLFWCSITGLAINVAHILNPDCNIKVIGMDGGRNLYFHSCVADFQKIKGNHNSCDWFKWGIPLIEKSLSKENIQIFNCSKKSQYVVNKDMKYSPVVSETIQQNGCLLEI